MKTKTKDLLFFGTFLLFFLLTGVDTGIVFDEEPVACVQSGGGSCR